VRNWREIEKQLAEDISKLKLHNTTKSNDAVASVLTMRNEIKDLQQMTRSPIKLLAGLKDLGISCTIMEPSERKQCSDSVGGRHEIMRGTMSVPIASLQKLVGLQEHGDIESALAVMDTDEAAAVRMALSVLSPTMSPNGIGSHPAITDWEEEKEGMRTQGVASQQENMSRRRNRSGSVGGGTHVCRPTLPPRVPAHALVGHREVGISANKAVANSRDANHVCFMRLLTNGLLVTKYSRKRGKPRLKILFSADGGKTLSWQKVGMSSTAPALGKSMALKDVQKVFSGCKTPNLQKLAAKMNAHARGSSAGRYFISIVTQERSLDLECDDAPKHARLLEGLRRLLADRGGGG
jgi:hypothetical protein